MKLRGLLTALPNDLATLGDAVLVPDDYHVIECPPIDEVLTFLVAHLPPQFRLVIAGREDPPPPAERLRTWYRRRLGRKSRRRREP